MGVLDLEHSKLKQYCLNLKNRRLKVSHVDHQFETPTLKEPGCLIMVYATYVTIIYRWWDNENWSFNSWCGPRAKFSKL